MLSLVVSPQGHNIFSNLSSTEYSDLMQLLKQSILATDLTLYFEYVLLNTRLLIKLLNLLVLRGPQSPSEPQPACLFTLKSASVPCLLQASLS